MAFNSTTKVYLALVGGIILVYLISRINFKGGGYETIPRPYNAHIQQDKTVQKEIIPEIELYMQDDVHTKATQVSVHKSNHREVVLHPENETCQHRLPKCIIIGIQKCGTSALLSFLSYHPQIAAKLGEVKFFNMFYKKGLGWYRKNMLCSYSNQISMEKSPSYFYRPRCGQRMKKMDENIKLMVIVKDPITRTQSHYAMRARGTPNYTRFENMLTNPKTGNLRTNHKFFRFSNYPSNIRQWLKIFSLDQIHFVDGLALETNPAGELRKAEDFLNIGTYFSEDNFVFNKTKGKYCVRALSGMECLGSHKGRAHPDIPPGMLVKLKNHFHPKNEEFFKLIGRRFDWGY